MPWRRKKIRRCNLRRTYFPVSQKRIIILKSLIIGIGWDMLYYQESHKGHSKKENKKTGKFSQIGDPLPPYGDFCLILPKLFDLFFDSLNWAVQSNAAWGKNAQFSRFLRASPIFLAQVLIILIIYMGCIIVIIFSYSDNYVPHNSPCHSLDSCLCALPGCLVKNKIAIMSSNWYELDNRH